MSLHDAVADEALTRAYSMLSRVVRFLRSAGLGEHRLTQTLDGLVWAERERG